MKRFAAVILLTMLAGVEGGCSYLTTHGRQEAAYARYVRRSSYGRVRLQSKLSSPKVQPVQMTETTSAGSGPESLTAGSDSR